MKGSSKIDGWIIAGGASSRMGQDKASLEIGGRKLIHIAARALSNICDGRVSIAGSTREFAPALSAFPDAEVPGHGPLAGISTSLSNGSSEWIAIISCDMPFITGEVFAILADHAGPEDDAVVPVQSDGRPQPLCALYRRRTVLPIVKDLIQSTDRSINNLLSRLSERYVPFSRFSDFQNAEHLFLNINSPADHERAKDIFVSSHY